MAAKAKIKDLIAAVIAGSELRSAWERLSACGQQGVDAILDALQGERGPAPADRHPRDIHEDLSGGLQAIAEVNPEPLIVALARRPEHTFSLIWALGSSREDAAVQALVEYAKHKDQWVRWAAVEGLVRFRKKSLLQPLLDALRDRSDQVRFTALTGLVKIADRRAIEPLKHYLADKRLKPGGRRIAGELLAKLEKSRR
jgi:HEAT repeat protein